MLTAAMFEITPPQSRTDAKRYSRLCPMTTPTTDVMQYFQNFWTNGRAYMRRMRPASEPALASGRTWSALVTSAGPWAGDGLVVVREVAASISIAGAVPVAGAGEI